MSLNKCQKNCSFTFRFEFRLFHGCNSAACCGWILANPQWKTQQCFQNFVYVIKLIKASSWNPPPPQKRFKMSYWVSDQIRTQHLAPVCMEHMCNSFPLHMACHGTKESINIVEVRLFFLQCIKMHLMANRDFLQTILAAIGLMVTICKSRY